MMLIVPAGYGSGPISFVPGSSMDITDTPAFVGQYGTPQLSGLRGMGACGDSFADGSGVDMSGCVSSSDGGGGTDWADIAKAISSASGAALSIYKSTQAPNLISGTNLVYNPANGQIINPAAVTIGATGTAGAQVASALSPTLMMGGALALILVVVLVSSKH